MSELLSSFVSEVSDWNYGPFARQSNSTALPFVLSSQDGSSLATIPFGLCATTTCLTPLQVIVPVAVAVAIAVGIAVPVANAAIQVVTR